MTMRCDVMLRGETIQNGYGMDGIYSDASLPICIGYLLIYILILFYFSKGAYVGANLDSDSRRDHSKMSNSCLGLGWISIVVMPRGGMRHCLLRNYRPGERFFGESRREYVPQILQAFLCKILQFPFFCHNLSPLFLLL